MGYATVTVLPNLVAGSSSSTTTSSATSRSTSYSSALEVFSGLPPEFLLIELTDGKVTAHKTEFLK
jgi:hypothetical protein